MSSQVLSDSSLPDEFLFGRSGYLFALLFVRHHLGVATIDQSLVLQVDFKFKFITVSRGLAYINMSC